MNWWAITWWSTEKRDMWTEYTSESLHSSVWLQEDHKQTPIKLKLNQKREVDFHCCNVGQFHLVSQWVSTFMSVPYRPYTHTPIGHGESAQSSALHGLVWKRTIQLGLASNIVKMHKKKLEKTGQTVDFLTSKHATIMDPSMTKTELSTAQRMRETGRPPTSVNLSMSGRVRWSRKHLLTSWTKFLSILAINDVK